MNQLHGVVCDIVNMAHCDPSLATRLCTAPIQTLRTLTAIPHAERQMLVRLGRDRLTRLFESRLTPRTAPVTDPRPRPPPPPPVPPPVGHPCAELLSAIQRLQRQLQGLEAALVHATPSQREDIAFQIQNTLDQLADLEGAYDDAGCVAASPPPSIEWFEKTALAIQMASTSFEEPDEGIYHAGRANDVLVLPPGADNAGFALVATDSGGVWLVSPPEWSGEEFATPLSDTWDDPDILCLAQGIHSPTHVYAGCQSSLRETDLTATAPLQNWRDISPDNGRVNRILVIPASPRVSFARIVVATSKGLFWASIPQPGHDYLWFLAAFPGGTPADGDFTGIALGADDLVVAGGGGVFVTGIFVGTWRGAGLTMARAAVNGVAPGDLNLVVLAVTSYGFLMFAVSTTKDLFMSAFLVSSYPFTTWNARTDTRVVDDRGATLMYSAKAIQPRRLPCIAIAAETGSIESPRPMVIGWLLGIYISFDGGTNWQGFYARDNLAMHTDTNGVYFDPTDPSGQRLFVCSDGGVATTPTLAARVIDNICFGTDDNGYPMYESAAVLPFDSHYNRFLRNIQFYSTLGAYSFYGALSASDIWVAGGTQDNGNICSIGLGPWINIHGCDGGDVAILQNGYAVQTPFCGGSLAAAEIVQLPRSNFQNINSERCPRPIPGPSSVVPLYQNGAFDRRGIPYPVFEAIRSPQFVNVRGHRMIAVAGATQGSPRVFGLFSEADGSGSYWHDLLTDLPSPHNALPLLTGAISAVGSATGFVVFVATTGGQVFKVDTVSLSVTELPVSGRFGPSEACQMNRVLVIDDSLFYVLFNLRRIEGYVLRYRGDGGTYRCDILNSRGGLPKLPVTAYFGISDWMGGAILAASGEQVFISDDQGESWRLAVNGLPAAPHCSDLRWAADQNGGFALYLSTYGRSVWTARYVS